MVKRHKLVLYLRYSLQVISLVVYIYLFTTLVYPVEQRSGLLMWYSRLDPWGLLSQLRWQYSFPLWGWLPILMLLITLLFGRVFCGWLCPFGAFMMLVDRLSRIVLKNKIFKKVVSFRNKTISKLQPIRYFWLMFTLILFIIGINWAYSLTPFALFSREIAKIMLGAVPWALILIIILTIFFSRIWCSILCPTGILLSFIGRYRLFRFQAMDRCTHCSKCTKNCPVNQAPNESGSARDGCLVCGECQNICPTNTIKFHPISFKRKNEEATIADEIAISDNQHSRRQFLKIAGTGMIAAALAFGGKKVMAVKKVLRPPGALPEEKFTSVCNRCGKCIKVCPNNALHPMPITEGIENFGTPQIIPRQANCFLCMSCQEVCPTGAITKVSFEQVHIGKAELNKKRCLAWEEQKFCLVCAEQCGYGAVKIDDQNRPYLIRDNCIGCGTCERACAAIGESAIRVRPQ